MTNADLIITVIMWLRAVIIHGVPVKTYNDLPTDTIVLMFYLAKKVMFYVYLPVCLLSCARDYLQGNEYIFMKLVLCGQVLM